MPWIVSAAEPVLVTGSNGFIGARVVARLLGLGFTHIRCFARPSSSLRRLQEVIQSSPRGQSAVEIVQGNLLSPDDCLNAMEGVSVAFHLAAGIDKSFAGCFMNSVLTTRNLLDAAVAGRTLKRFVNVSSFAVYSTLGVRWGSRFDETIPLETQPNERQDPYGYGKLKQEQIVRRYHETFGIPYVILRPGAVYGPGKATLSGRIGIDTFGVFLHIGGGNPIPFTYVDNCAEAVVLAGLVKGVDGQVFNVVDDDLPTSRRFLRLYKTNVRRFLSIPIPYSVAYILSFAWESYSKWSHGQLPARFNRRRASAEWKRQQYANNKLKQLLGWTPRVPFNEGSKALFSSIGHKA